MVHDQYSAKEFDERQLLIRGQVFWHGLLVAVVLLVVNAVLQVNGVMWASGFAQNILIVLAIVAVVATEAILRGSFFGRRQNRWLVIAIFGIVGLAMIGLHTSGALETVGLPRSDHIAFIVAGVMFCCMTAVGISKELLERKAKED